jgi:hypothetical protein
LWRLNPPHPCHNAFSGPGSSDVPKPVTEHRRHVFISYSRADRAWVDRLRIIMAPLLREAGEDLVLWDDSQIRPGELWQKAIETALARARVALLLVSADFLASDFVMGREVPVLLEAAEREGVPILWVSLSPCFVSRTSIHQYQAVLPPEPPIAEMTEPEQRRALVRIAEEVHRALVEATERDLERERAEAEHGRLEEKRDRPAEEQEEVVEEKRLLTRRNLLLTAAGVPLVAFGLTQLAVGGGGKRRNINRRFPRVCSQLLPRFVARGGGGTASQPGPDPDPADHPRLAGAPGAGLAHPDPPHRGARPH